MRKIKRRLAGYEWNEMSFVMGLVVCIGLGSCKIYKWLFGTLDSSRHRDGVCGSVMEPF